MNPGGGEAMATVEAETRQSVACYLVSCGDERQDASSGESVGANLGGLSRYGTPAEGLAEDVRDWPSFLLVSRDGWPRAVSTTSCDEAWDEESDEVWCGMDTGQPCSPRHWWICPPPIPVRQPHPPWRRGATCSGESQPCSDNSQRRSGMTSSSTHFVPHFVAHFVVYASSHALSDLRPRRFEHGPAFRSMKNPPTNPEAPKKGLALLKQSEAWHIQPRSLD